MYFEIKNENMVKLESYNEWRCNKKYYRLNPTRY